MKITYFINQYPKVSHSFIRREIQALEKNGFDVQRVSIRSNDAEVVDEFDKKEKTITAYILNDSLLKLFFLMMKTMFFSPFLFYLAFKKSIEMNRMSERNILYHFLYLLEACKLKQLCRRFGSQHVHAHFGTNSTEISMLCYLLGGPTYSFTVHGPEEFDKPLGLHLKEKVRLSSFVVAISSFGRSQLYRWCDYKDWEKIKVVHCGLDDEFFIEEKREINNIKKKSFLCIGRLCEQKGQLLLLRGIKKIIDKGFDVNLVLAGDGEMRSEVEELINKLGINDNVEITGWVSSNEIHTLLDKSDAMILPSFGEGLPVAIMEALATRTPVITTYIAGIPELIHNGKTGWLCHAGDHEAIANIIEKFIYTTNDTLLSITNQGYEEVKKHHSISIEAKKLSRFFVEYTTVNR
tara:strand:- start:3008 stop:4228 length:1221 start_codon:yes stop_codon:yes gene_type:complete